MSDQIVMTIPEVADALRVSRWNVYERIRRNEIPTVHIGRSLRVPRKWLDDTIDRLCDGEDAS